MRILAFLARRLGIFAVSLLGASALVFAVCSALPGEVAEIILGEGATPAQIEALTDEVRERLSCTGRLGSPEKTSGGSIHENNRLLGRQKTDAERHSIPQQG